MDAHKTKDIKEGGTCLSAYCVCKDEVCLEIKCDPCDFNTKCTIIASGRLNTVDGKIDYGVFYDDKHEGSRHVN